MESDINLELSNMVNNECLKMSKLYNMQEMTPNDHGIIGLNKPKKIIKIKRGKDSYEIAEVRSMHLTLRNNQFNDFIKEQQILDLLIHELTHTTCNDIYWKEDNHKYPYPEYHRLMRTWAKECNVL
jgi:hypothetical protein